MTRRLLLTVAVVGGAVLGGCSQPSVAKCSQNSDCPRDAICVTGICQKGVPSGGAGAAVSGSARLTSGTLTMDATVGQPVSPAAAAGTTTITPAENTR